MWNLASQGIRKIRGGQKGELTGGHTGPQVVRKAVPRKHVSKL